MKTLSKMSISKCESVKGDWQMEYKEVVCRNCGGHMKLAPGATRIRCEYCETEYILSSEKKNKMRFKSLILPGVVPYLKAMFLPAGRFVSLMMNPIPPLPLYVRDYIYLQIMPRYSCFFFLLPTT